MDSGTPGPTRRPPSITDTLSLHAGPAALEHIRRNGCSRDDIGTLVRRRPRHAASDDPARYVKPL